MATLPYMVHIAPSDIPSASSGTWSLSVESANLGGMQLSSAGVQNSYIEWPFLCAAGTYRLTLAHVGAANRGIYTPTIDGVAISTIDGYTASTTRNVVGQVSDIALAAGNHLLRFTMATKNGSSSGYLGGIQHVALLRVSA